MGNAPILYEHLARTYEEMWDVSIENEAVDKAEFVTEYGFCKYDASYGGDNYIPIILLVQQQGNQVESFYTIVSELEYIYQQSDKDTTEFLAAAFEELAGKDQINYSVFEVADGKYGPPIVTDLADKEQVETTIPIPTYDELRNAYIIKSTS